MSDHTPARDYGHETTVHHDGFYYYFTCAAGDVAHTDNALPSLTLVEMAAEAHELGHVTKTGRVLTEQDIHDLAEEAERGYDVSHLLPVKQRSREPLAEDGPLQFGKIPDGEH